MKPTQTGPHLTIYGEDFLHNNKPLYVGCPFSSAAEAHDANKAMWDIDEGGRRLDLSLGLDKENRFKISAWCSEMYWKLAAEERAAIAKKHHEEWEQWLDADPGMCEFEHACFQPPQSTNFLSLKSPG